MPKSIKFQISFLLVSFFLLWRYTRVQSFYNYSNSWHLAISQKISKHLTGLLEFLSFHLIDINVKARMQS